MVEDATTRLLIDIVPDNPNQDDADQLLHMLNTDNVRKTGIVELDDFAVLLRDPETHAVIGGLWGEDDFGWAFISYLYVPEALQGLRLGSRLIAEAELIARNRGAMGLWVNTFEFQAKGFYEKQGFEVFGSLDAGPRAVGQYFLRKPF